MGKTGGARTVMPGQPPRLSHRPYMFSSSKLEVKLKDTVERLEKLEKAMRRLEEDWTETYGKFRTMQLRVAKQVQRLDQAPESSPGEQPEGSGGTPISSLSPKAQLIARQIAEHRKANGGGQ